MFVDYHVHSEFSDDSEYEMEQVVKDAISMGMRELCFTDHVDYGIKRDWDDPRGMLYRKGGKGEPERMPVANVDYPGYAEKIKLLQEKYRDRITIKLGMEFGMQRHTIAAYEKLFAGYPFDFIILSVHEVEDKELWTGDLRRGISRQEYYEKYYMEMLAITEKFHNYSVLGHMDLIARYDEEGEYPFEKVRPYIEKILKTVIADGKGIEVNTSCYRYGLSDLTPSIQILEMYRDLGGKILTIGSDSHKEEHLGDYIPETLTQLKAMGFKEICTYEKMQPIFHTL
ncbi:MAG: histidinol-phosphatase HisJ family protein [Eubacteriales bacterium]|nr:histidinol-phosphatase HisJ family protein [Eubacteriales bacterium]